MRSLAIAMIFLAGCNTSAGDIDRAGIIAEIATRTAWLLLNQPQEPGPRPAGCVAGCGCNGTGKEKTGDGISVVDCRCDDDCECKQKKAGEPQDAVKPEEPPVPEDPPLVPIEPKVEPKAEPKVATPEVGRVECQNGTCYWIDSRGRRFRIVR